jgi:hypothetical protein
MLAYMPAYPRLDIVVCLVFATPFVLLTALMPTLTFTVAFHHVGIAGSPAELGVDNTNTWHVPVDAHGDAFPSLEEYFAHPLAAKGGFRGIPAFITFPGRHLTSMKELPRRVQRSSFATSVAHSILTTHVTWCPR